MSDDEIKADKKDPAGAPGRRLFKQWLLGIGTLVFLILSIFMVVAVSSLQSMNSGNQVQTLSFIIMVGLSLVVALSILLVIFYKVVGIENANEALGLPSGSIRALIAFCLVIMFMSMSVFLYEGIRTPPQEVTKSGVSQKVVDKLTSQFEGVVPRVELKDGVPVSDPVAPATCKSSTSDDGKKVVPAVAAADCYLYDVTYYLSQSKDSSDLAKQIFTLLGGLLSSVIGFYFGSSTATAGVKTGVNAAGGPAPATAPTTGCVGQPLNDAIRADSDATTDLGRIKAVLDKLKAQNLDPADDTLKKAQTLFDTNTSRAGDIKTKLAAARDSAAKFGTMTNDADNAAEAAAVLKASNDIKALAAQIKTDANAAEALLK